MADRFVWLRSYRGDCGPEPQRWSADVPVGCLQNPRVLAVHPLGPADAGLSLESLAAKYPPPAQSEDQSP